MEKENTESVSWFLLAQEREQGFASARFTSALVNCWTPLACLLTFPGSSLPWFLKQQSYYLLSESHLVLKNLVGNAFLFGETTVIACSLPGAHRACPFGASSGGRRPTGAIGGAFWSIRGAPGLFWSSLRWEALVGSPLGLGRGLFDLASPNRQNPLLSFL